MKNIYQLLRKTLGKVRSDGFLVSVAKVSIGTGVSHACVLMVTPLITRLYSPSELSLFGIFWSVVAVASVAACLKYELAILVAKSKEDESGLAMLSCLLLVPVSVFSGLVLYLLVWFQVGAFAELDTSIAILAVFLVFVLGLYQIFRYLLVAREEYVGLSVSIALQGFFRAIFPLGIAFMGYFGLVVAEIAGRVAGFFPVLRRVGFDRDFSLRDLRSVAIRYRSYSLLVLPSSLLSMTANMATIPIVASVFGLKEAGFVFLAQRVVSVPVTLLSQSFADVFQRRLSDCSPSEVRNFFWSSFYKIGSLSLAVFAPAAILLPSVVGLVFGESWGGASSLFSVFCALSFMSLVVVPLSRTLFTFERPELKFYFDACMLILPNAGLFWAAKFGFEYAMAAFVVGGCIAHIVYFLLILQVLNERLRISRDFL